MTTREELESRLRKSFNPTHLEIIDQSAQHAGHGATGGHFRVEITSLVFKDVSMLDAHRKIYDVLDDLLDEKIHALSLRTKASE